MTASEVVSHLGEPLFTFNTRFKAHYPFVDNQLIYDYVEHVVVFDSGGKVIAVAIWDTSYVTSKKISVGDADSKVLSNYGYTQLNEIRLWTLCVHISY